MADLAADVVPLKQTQPQLSYWADAAPDDFATQAPQSQQLPATNQQAAQVQVNTSANASTIPAFGLTSKPAAPAAVPPASQLNLDLVSMMMLPRPKLLTFDGSPLNWNAFVQNFTASVAARIQDPQLRMQYLLQLCTGDAYEHIKDCALLHGDIA